ncbi:nestin [Pelobates fuscus]|uniref:nestin n=1 Tax=Pelobates fuscus TaxID=191477 RepID=UPI002FE472C4
MESSYLASLSLGEESSQMWSLNKRLEAYLSRVKALEEENELLRAEIHQLQSSKSESCWKKKFFNEMRKLREVLDESHAEVVRVEADRDNIYEEIEFIKERCLQERHAQEDAKKELSESKKLLEEENRAQIWLKERLLQLEGELEEIIKAHEEDKELMEEEISSISQRLQNFKVAPVVIQPVNVDDYANKLSEIWREAVEGYKSEVSVLETSLSESRENLRKVLEENKQSKIHLQNLEKEMQSLKTRKDLLEEILSTQLQEQKEEEGNLQCEIEDLEKEKQHLRTQIAQVLEDRQQLMHLKMSLSLEVATYRSLLEAESTRIYSPGMDYKLSSAFSDSFLEPKNARRRQNRDNKKVLSTEYNLSSNKKQRAEKNEASRTSAHHLLNVKNTSYEKRTSPVTKEFQKVSSVLQSQSYTKAPIAKAVSSLPALESSFERRSQSAEVFRKTNSKTVSPSYSLDSSKDKGLQEQKKYTKDLPVLKEHIYSTEERDSGKKEALDKVNIKSHSTSSQEAPTSQLKEDNLDVTLKNIVEINKSIAREYVQKVQEKKEEEQEIQLSETHQEEKKNLNVPKHDTSEDIVLNIAYQDGSYKSTEAIQASEEHATTRETISYQSIDFSLQDVIESNFSEEKEVDEGKVAEALDLHKLNTEADLTLSPEISEFDQKHEIPTFQITAVEKKEFQLLSMDNDNVSEIIRKTVGGLLGSNLKIMSVTEVEHVSYQEDDSQGSQSFDQHIADQLSIEDVNVQPNREGQETVDLDNAENKTVQLPHEEQDSQLSYEEEWTSKNLEEPVQQMQVFTVLKQYAAELHEIKEHNLQQDQEVEKILSLNAMAEESKLSYDGKTTENITDIEEPVQQSEMFTLELEQASLQQFHEATSLELENAEKDDQKCSTFIGTEENVEQIIASVQVNQEFNSRFESENQHFDKLTEDEDSSLKENIIEEKDFGFTNAGLHSIKLTYEHEGQLSDIEQKSDTSSDDKILNGVDDSIQMLDNKISLEQSVDVEQETTQPLVIEDDSLQHSLLKIKNIGPYEVEEDYKTINAENDYQGEKIISKNERTDVGQLDNVEEKEPSAKEVLTQHLIEEGADLTVSSEVNIDDQQIELKDYAHHVEENLQQTSDNEELCQSSDHEEHTAILEHQKVVGDHDATESFSDIRRNDAETFNLDIGLSNDTIKIEVDIVDKVQESQYEIFEHEHTKDEKEEHVFSENENDIAERQQECFLTETNLETNVSFTTKEVLNTQFELSANLQCDASEEENENKSPDHWVNEVVTVAKEDFHYVNQSPVEPKSEEVYSEEIEEIKERERGFNVNEEVKNAVENKEDIEVTYTEENVESKEKTEEYDRENVEAKETEEHVHKNVEALNTDENNEDVTKTEETIKESKESTKPQEIKENAEIKTVESREEIKTVEIIEPKENVVYEEATTVTKQDYEHEEAIQLEEYVEENVKAFNAEGKDCEEVRKTEETIEENEEHSKLEEHIKADEFTETVENEDNVKTGELTETEVNIEHKELRTTEEHVDEIVEAINTEENLKGNQDITKAGEIIEESEENIKTEEIIKENEEITIKEEIIKEYEEVTKAEENIVENEEDSKPEVNIKEDKVTETVGNEYNVKTGEVTQTEENIEENKVDSNTEDNIQEDEVTEIVKNEDDVKTGDVTETEENIECKEITTTDGHVEENVETINTEDSEDVIIAGENIEESEEDIKTEEIIPENEEITTKEDIIKEYEEVTKAEENIVENEEDSKPEVNIKEDKVTETVENKDDVKTGEVTEIEETIKCKELTTTDEHVEENLETINTEISEDVLKAGENIEGSEEDIKTEEIIQENEEITTKEDIIKEYEAVTKAEENIVENEEDSKPEVNIKADKVTETVGNKDNVKTGEVTEIEENIKSKELTTTTDEHVEENLETINTEDSEDVIKTGENIEESEEDIKTEEIILENEEITTKEDIIKEYEEVTKAEENIVENEEDSKPEVNIKEDKVTETVENEDNVKTGEVTETEENIEHKELRTTEEHVEENVEAINTEENLKGNEDIIKAGEIIEESEQNIKTEEIIKENEEITIKEDIIKEYEEVTKAEENIVENEEDSKPEVNIKEDKVTETVGNEYNVKTGEVTQTEENIEENKEDSNTEDNIQEDEVTEIVKNEDDVKTGDVTETEENIECKEITTTDGHVEENVETINTEDSEDVIIAGENIEESEEDIKTEEIIPENEEITIKEDIIKEYEEVTKAEENIVENEEDSKPEVNIKEDKVTETVGNEYNVKTGEVTQTEENIEENKEDSNTEDNIQEDEVTETMKNEDDVKTGEVTETEENIECKEITTTDGHVEENVEAINTEDSEDVIIAGENIEESEEDIKTEEIIPENEEITKAEENTVENEEDSKPEVNIKEDKVTETVENEDNVKTGEVTETEENIEHKELKTTEEHVEENVEAINTEENLKGNEDVIKAGENIEEIADIKTEEIIKENEELTTEEEIIKECEEVTKAEENIEENEDSKPKENIKEDEVTETVDHVDDGKTEEVTETEENIECKEPSTADKHVEEILETINSENNIKNNEDLIKSVENIEASEEDRKTEDIIKENEKLPTEENIKEHDEVTKAEGNSVENKEDTTDENVKENKDATTIEETIKLIEVVPKTNEDIYKNEDVIKENKEVTTEDNSELEEETKTHENTKESDVTAAEEHIEENEFLTKTEYNIEETEGVIKAEENEGLPKTSNEIIEGGDKINKELTNVETVEDLRLSENENIEILNITEPHNKTKTIASPDENEENIHNLERFVQHEKSEPSEENDSPSLLQAENYSEYTVKISEIPNIEDAPKNENDFVNLEEQTNAVELSSEIPTADSHVRYVEHENDIAKFEVQSFIDEQQDASQNIITKTDNEDSEVEESVDSQEDLSLLSQRSEEFEISSDYHQEKTLPDTTPLPNMDYEFEDIPKEHVVLPLESTDISEENQSIEESDKHDFLADEFAEVAVEKPEENEPAKVKESVKSQEDVSLLSQRSEGFEISSDDHQKKTLPDTTPLPNVDNEFEDLPKEQVVLPLESTDISEENQSIEESDKHDLLADEFAEVAVEKPEENKPAEVEESIASQDDDKYVTDEEREELNVFKDDHATDTVKQVANETLQKNQESISVNFQSVSSKSEELVNIVFQGNQQFEIDQYQDRVSDSEDAGSSDDGSPNATIKFTSEHEDIRKVITTEVYAEVEVTEEFTVTSKELGHIVFNNEETKETPAEPISACDDIVQIECNLSDQEKEVASESSDSSCDLSNAPESSELKSQSIDKFDHSALEFTKLNSANIDAVNGQQANEKFGWSDDMLNGHSEREDKEHEQSCKKGYIQLDTDAPFMHAYDQEFLGDSVIKFAMSEGKDEGLFQALLETSELKDLSRTEEVHFASDSQTTKESSVYLDSANENEYTKLVQNPYLIDKDFHDQPQVISTKLPLTEEALIDSTNVQGSETYAGVSNVKHEDDISWSSDD